VRLNFEVLHLEVVLSVGAFERLKGGFFISQSVVLKIRVMRSSAVFYREVSLCNISCSQAQFNEKAAAVLEKAR
jgi:hypothetical protein